MKKKIHIWIITGCILFCSCNDWLDLLPRNEQVTDDYWKSKEDVEAVIASGYYKMRESTSDFIYWGELRGASIYAYNEKDQIKLQDFQLESTEKICSWGHVYLVINMANSVIAYAPRVLQFDESYSEGAMNAHLTEAYFMRALMYFYIVRNFKEAPLITDPYVDDGIPLSIAKSSENNILEQIKNDIKIALDSEASKEFYENEIWNATKGRATKWALYALMAEVALWTEDYDTCIQYADYLINSTATRRPAFMSIPEQWFTIFNPGNSNESIFELNWDHSTFLQTKYSPSTYFEVGANADLQYTEAMKERLISENFEVILHGKETVRGQYGAFVLIGDIEETSSACIWKYWGTGVQSSDVMRTTADANWIIYRMADVMLMKAEALIWRGKEGWVEAIEIMNQIRNRANLPNLEISLDEIDEEAMLNLLLNERDMELAAEGKRWYDLLRFGKGKNFKYKSSFINMIMENNSTANDIWIRSVLQNEYAWYLPIYYKELEDNTKLTQNSYYLATNSK